jgi:hypothetical protein
MAFKVCIDLVTLVDYQARAARHHAVPIGRQVMAKLMERRVHRRYNETQLGQAA